jgi:competence protein ComEA
VRIKIFGKELFFPVWVKFLITVFPVIILIILGLCFDKRNPDESELFKEILSSTESIITPNVDASADTFTPAPSPDADISVYIVGEVTFPDVYSLPDGSLIVDLLETAGGPSADADLEAVNLAYPLANNMMIKIPSVYDSDKSWLIDEGLTFFPETQNTQKNSDSDAAVKININTASLSELCTLPGIGKSTAQKIIDYRSKNGNFESIEGIMNVGGIKQAKYEQIKDYIIT